ncbi:protein of unknown function [Magnetospirillum gryphiswaldense MSR-1 v2]|uniref:Uncharacterized protein n=1 Tax=Magnetospirillum gryphiswaldense (strain DSM 6361 / JCM 21280 / NBRC 15271 / MSR-1) TaxID=431944 RepID=V6F8Z1_MAGGM|nr:protein of unknown function [Magnetospirillum gryphiswaldense MSR-1 v2]
MPREARGAEQPARRLRAPLIGSDRRDMVLEGDEQ